jgi:hypothetical protein
MIEEVAAFFSDLGRSYKSRSWKAAPAVINGV